MIFRLTFKKWWKQKEARKIERGCREMMLEQRKIGNLVCWRRLKGRKNPSDVLTLKDRVLVEGPEHKRVMFGCLRAV